MYTRKFVINTDKDWFVRVMKIWAKSIFINQNVARKNGFNINWLFLVSSVHPHSSSSHLKHLIIVAYLRVKYSSE